MSFEGPFSTFNFRASFRLGIGLPELCAGEFSEVDGLEMTIEPKTFREGGNNTQPVHLMGKVSYGQLTLRRGMTKDQGMWTWFEAVAGGAYGLRALGRIEIVSTDRTEGEEGRPKADTVFLLTGVLPTRLRAPALSAKDGQLAIEEMQLVFDSMLRAPGGD